MVLRRILALGAWVGLFASALLAKPIELNVWEFPRVSDPDRPHDRYAWMRALLEDFEAENPGVTTRLTELTWKAGPEKIRISLFAGRPPDIISGALDPSLLKRRAYDPIDPFLSDEVRADHLPGALEAFQVEGSTYAWPWCRKGDFLFANREHLLEAGVSLPKDRVLDAAEFESLLAQLSLRPTREEEEGKSAPLGMALTPGKSAELGFFLPETAPLLGPQGEPRVEAAGLPQTLSRMRDWLEKGYLPPDSPGWNAKDLWLAFTRFRTVSMAPFGLWALKALEKQRPFEFEVLALPGVPQGASFRPSATVGYFVLRRPRAEAERKMAHRLAEYLARRGQASLESYGQFPTRRSAPKLFQDSPPMQAAQALLDHSQDLPSQPGWASLEEHFKRGLQGHLLKGSPSETEFLDSLAAKAREAPPGDGGARTRPFVASLMLGLLFLGAASWLLRSLSSLAGQGPGILFLGVLPLAGLGLFLAYPGARGLLLAFESISPQGGGASWVGLENFVRALKDPGFLVGCRNTLLYAAVIVPAQLASGLILASWIHPLSQGLRSWFRGAFYLPGVASIVALAIVWRQVFDLRAGVLNRVLPVDSGAGTLARLFLSCLERVPTALGWFFLGMVLSGLFVGVFRDPKTPRQAEEARHKLLLGWGVLLLAWVASGADPEYLAKQPIPWLSDQDLSFWSVMGMVVVRGPGGALLVYLAALEAVPKELYEAAQVDGASPWQKFYHVTLPSLAGTTFFLTITGIIDSFQAFGQVFLLTDGGPGYSSTVVVHRMYLAAFRELDFGLAAAQGGLLFLAIAALGGWQAYRQREA